MVKAKAFELDERKALDALGAQRLLDQLAAFHELDLLQVGLERTAGRIHGEAAIMAELGFLAAIFTVSHRPIYLSSAMYSERKRASSYHNRPDSGQSHSRGETLHDDR